MKHGWEYKKLGEVCTIERGGSPRPINNYITDDPNGVNWIKIGDAVDGSKYINSTKERIRPEGMKKSRFVHKGDFILSNSMSFGKPYILGVDGCIHDGWLVIHDDNDTFNKDFLYYYLGSPMMYRKFENLAVGGVVNNLNSQLVRSVSVPIPALAVQERIVGELDKVREIIEKKKEQLKELDNLAQSIFYDMFGDPVENEKGWEVCRLNEVASLKNGLNYDKVDKGLRIKILGVGDFKNNKIITSSEVGHTTVSNEVAKEFLLKDDDVVFVRSNGSKSLIGRCVLVKTQGESLSFSGFCIRCRLLSNGIDPRYFLLFMQTPMIKERLTGGGRGCNIQNINQNILGSQIITVPPLSLQQAFAEKVEAIEKQKELITASLKEAETLFDARMEYWFGE